MQSLIRPINVRIPAGAQVHVAAAGSAVYVESLSAAVVLRIQVDDRGEGLMGVGKGFELAQGEQFENLFITNTGLVDVQARLVVTHGRFVDNSLVISGAVLAEVQNWPAVQDVRETVPHRPYSNIIFDRIPFNGIEEIPAAPGQVAITLKGFWHTQFYNYTIFGSLAHATAGTPGFEVSRDTIITLPIAQSIWVRRDAATAVDVMKYIA